MKQEDIIAVFPLPNVVFFPKTHLPLHIFEPRYSQMVEDTIRSKQLIGMFLLQPGWQDNYYGNPPVHPVGCAGEMIYVERVPEEKFNIMLRGVYRARALETVQDHPYRKMRVEVLPEVLDREETLLVQLREILISDYRKLASQVEEFDPSAIETMTDFVEIIHTIATSLQLDLELKMDLLQENDVYARALRLSQVLRNKVSVLDWTNRFARLRPNDPGQN